MINQRNTTQIDQASTLRKSNKSNPSTPSPSRRKKIFAQDHKQIPYSPPRQDEDTKKSEIVDQLYKTIENINWKLQDFHSLQRQNQTLKNENSRLRGMIDQNAENTILKQQKRELETKLFEHKKRLEKAKILVELMFGEDSQKKKQLSEFHSIFDF